MASKHAWVHEADAATWRAHPPESALTPPSRSPVVPAHGTKTRPPKPQSDVQEPRKKAERAVVGMHWAPNPELSMSIPRPPPRVSTNTAVGSSGTMYVDPPPIRRSSRTDGDAPANSAATSPSDMATNVGYRVVDRSPSPGL